MNIIRMATSFVFIPTIISPILEEIVFRKVIFGAIYKRTNFFIGAAASSLIFALIHGEPKHLLIYASMGFVFAFVYVKTKRRSEEHTSELQSRGHLVCRLLIEKTKR